MGQVGRPASLVELDGRRVVLRHDEMHAAAAGLHRSLEDRTHVLTWTYTIYTHLPATRFKIQVRSYILPLHNSRFHMLISLYILTLVTFCIDIIIDHLL